MFNRFGKNHIRFFVFSACLAVLCSENAFSKPKNELVKEEPGFYYGYGKSATKEEADFMAKRDLIENALTATVRLTNPAASKVTVGDDVVKARLGNEKPFQASKDGKTVTYRMKDKDWEKAEEAYAAKLRTSLSSAYNNFNSKKDVAEKFSFAAEILSTLAVNGESDLLTLQNNGTELFSRKVESVCAKLAAELEMSFSVKDKIITPETPVVVTVKDGSGKEVAGLTVKAVWEVPYVSVISEGAETSEVVSYLTTDDSGNVTVEYPVAEEYKNRVVSLTISTALAQVKNSTAEMRKIDASSAEEARFYCVEDISEAFKTVEVAAGKFMAGKLENDKKASQREVAHEVDLPAFEMSVAPVTNIQYMAYVYLTRAESNPEYVDNEDYSNPLQPIIGVSLTDAQGYAEWLSGQLECTFRLPVEEEWEKAARGGAQFIYPWGDDDPKKDKNANFKGNGLFNGPSPVGSFENGNNGLGLVDMSGNVWEWTTSNKNEKEENDLRTVKGGSWMDGPADLRISNYKNVDLNTGYPDVGFRLVKEVSK